MRIAITTDHAGFEALQSLQVHIESLGHTCLSFGPEHFDPQDDYPDFMFPAAKAVANGDADAGVILGGSGQGEAMAANRIKGVRCAVFYGPVAPRHPIDAHGHVSDDPYEIIKLSRLHNDANVLSLGSRFLDMEEMKLAVSVWLEMSFSGEERHLRRIGKLDEF
ncbi:MAG TPA: RpiB/LacA/LacB family sugar-phosphate isomerase [Candidatus Saccharimonadales bacterium]|nr:RpiB/LacA/LacB family sugar-phosphate isomerase [Candidatus Saccharimonadales bacterium]